ncbi:MAG: galactokinase [Candidatus Marinimicrobia bacterium]|nr:galactokinase [Candidatus Neomarinimicrobiota bacterium]
MKILEIAAGIEIEKQLKNNGMNANSIATKINLFKRIVDLLTDQGTDTKQEAISLFVPGRLEVLGKHTDYAGGKSLVMAADRGICLVAIPNKEKEIQIQGLSTDKEVVINLASVPDPEPGHWSNYPITVVRRLMMNFPGEIQGCRIVFSSDLPIAAGMSSSSALIIAVFMALSKISHLHKNERFSSNIRNLNDLAEYAATIENGLSFRELKGEKGVGTFGGSEDHTAILNCHAGMVSEFSYCPIEFHQNINISDDYIFIVAASGVKAKKTGNAMDKYNRVSLLVREIRRLWQEKTGSEEQSLQDILESTPDAKRILKKLILETQSELFSKEDLVDRLDHFISENCKIIPKAVQALMKNDYRAFGEDVDLSQKVAEKLLKNQVPETTFLCDSARKSGAVAASAFGAGFGGSVWALIKNEEPEKFIQIWKSAYQKEFPEVAKEAGFFICRTGPAAFYLEKDASYNALNNRL